MVHVLLNPPCFVPKTRSLTEPGAHCFPNRLAKPSKHPASAQVCLVLARLMFYVGAGICIQGLVSP